MMTMMGGGGGGGPVSPNDSLTLDFVYQGLPFAYISTDTPPNDSLDQMYQGYPYGVAFV